MKLNSQAGQQTTVVAERIYNLLFFFFLKLKAPTSKIAAELIPIRKRAAAADIATPFFNTFIPALL